MNNMEIKRKKRVLLGIDFIGSNYKNGRDSILKWWKYISKDDVFDCIVGVSNFCGRYDPLPGGNGATPADIVKDLNKIIPQKRLFQWTSDIDDDLLNVVKHNGYQSVPFYNSFNYGSVINRMLLLTFSHNCDYLVRIDPGTMPNEKVSFTQLMQEHEKIIKGDIYTIVSRKYEKRLALRDIFVKKGLEMRHAELVQQYTGINTFSQITGGALLTQKSPGIPAICFPYGQGLTLVWGSDDGIYQILPETMEKSRMLNGFPVKRFDNIGKLKKSTEYYRGIIGAVFLNAICAGKCRSEAENMADLFMQQLKEKILDSKKCIYMDRDHNWFKNFTRNNIAPSLFLDSIIKGYRNYKILLQEWTEICKILKNLIVKKTNP